MSHAQTGLKSAPWVLVVDSGTGQNRSALAAVRAVAAAGYRAAVTVTGRSSLAAASRYCARVVRTPPVGDAGFATAVGAEIADRDYLDIMCASDAAIHALAAPGADLIDKERLAARATRLGLRMPPGRTFPTAASLLAASETLGYPVVVKSGLKASTASLPAQRVDSALDLRQFDGAPGPFTVQPFVDAPMHALVGVMWQGRLRLAVHQVHERIWPPACGDACAAYSTVPDDDLQQQVERLLSDYNGIFQVEFVGDYLVDVNPRVYGSLPLATAAGCDLAGAYLRLVQGLPVDVAVPRAGAHYTWWEGEVRHVLSRRREVPIGVRAGTRILVSALAGDARRELADDPRPVMARLRHAAVK